MSVLTLTVEVPGLHVIVGGGQYATEGLPPEFRRLKGLVADFTLGKQMLHEVLKALGYVADAPKGPPKTGSH